MKIQLEKVIPTIVCILSVITMSSLVGYQLNITYLEYAMIIICLLYSLALGINTEDLRRIGVVLVIFLPITVIQMFIYPQSLLEWLRIPLMVISFTMFGCKIRRINIAEILYRVVFVISALSLLVYFFVEILNIQIPYTFTNIEWLPTYRNYLNIYFSRIDLGLDRIGFMQIPRNGGIFTEPGLFSVLLVMAFYLYIVTLKRKNRIELLVLIIAIFTTTSTTGWLLAIIILAYHILTSKSYHGRQLALLLAPIIVLGIAVVAQTLLNIKAANHAFSYTARSTDLMKGFELFLKRPILGWGYKNRDAYYSITSGMFYVSRPNSNGITTALYQLGLVGIFAYIYPITQSLKGIALAPDKKRDFYMGIVIVILIIIGEPIQYDAIILLMIGILYGGYKLPEREA